MTPTVWWRFLNRKWSEPAWKLWGNDMVEDNKTSMTLEAGDRIWFPCEVKPGPFPDERLVRVRENGHERLGFVSVYHLKQPISEGKTEILASVVSVSGEKFMARFPGEALMQSFFEGVLERVRPIDSL